MLKRIPLLINVHTKPLHLRSLFRFAKNPSPEKANKAAKVTKEASFRLRPALTNKVTHEKKQKTLTPEYGRKPFIGSMG